MLSQPLFNRSDMESPDARVSFLSLRGDETGGEGFTGEGEGRI